MLVELELRFSRVTEKYARFMWNRDVPQEIAQARRVVAAFVGARYRRRKILRRFYESQAFMMSEALRALDWNWADKLLMEMESREELK